MSALRLGTRASALALTQARWVAERLPGAVELVQITTAGDLAQDVGDKSRWTGGLEQALVAGEIDLAVHSAKDVPGELAEGTAIIAAPPRLDPRDLLVGASSLDALAPGARVGTASPRRRAQLLALRADLVPVELRGNIDTRLRKLADGDADVLVLAAAGLARLGIRPGLTGPLEGVPVVSAPGQGTLALQARASSAIDVGAALRHPPTMTALAVERGVVRRLDASCHTPVGVHADVREGGAVRVRAFLGLPDGTEWIVDELSGGDPATSADRLADRLLAAGAADLLARAAAAPAP